MGIDLPFTFPTKGEVVLFLVFNRGLSSRLTIIVVYRELPNPFWGLHVKSLILLLWTQNSLVNFLCMYSSFFIRVLSTHA